MLRHNVNSFVCCLPTEQASLVQTAVLIYPEDGNLTTVMGLLLAGPLMFKRDHKT